MNETELKIPSSDGVVLQARMLQGRRDETAVICHPHPSYGGTMDNNVVLAARDALAGKGLCTIRFNMRGVGASTGSFASGEGEARDVEAVFRHAAESKTGTGGVHLAAYSFGAWVGLMAVASGIEPKTLILVSPPLDFADFSGLALPACPCLILVGDRDGFCAVPTLEAWLKEKGEGRADVRLEVLAGTDHFYRGREDALERHLSEFHG